MPAVVEDGAGGVVVSAIDTSTVAALAAGVVSPPDAHDASATAVSATAIHSSPADDRRGDTP